MATVTDTFEPLNIQVDGLVDGTTVLERQPQPPGRDEDTNLIEIVLEVPGPVDVGLIDPELKGGLSERAWILRSWNLRFAGLTGGAARIAIVDENSALIELVDDTFAGTAHGFGDRGVYIPPQAQILVDSDGAGAGPHFLTFALWDLDATNEALAAV